MLSLLCNLFYLSSQNTLKIEVLSSLFYQIGIKCLESLCNVSGFSKRGNYRIEAQSVCKGHNWLQKFTRKSFFESTQPADSEAFSSPPTTDFMILEIFSV